LQRSIELKLSRLKTRQAAICQTLQAVSPLATLDRGYAISQRQDNQQIIKSSQQLAINDLMLTRFAQGQVVSEVKEIIHD
jgi:exodeoxyribonuclease VII large subunit